MEILTDLKAILHSKRANIYYLEKCRIMQKDGRVLYLTEAKNENQYWNIPIANTTCLLLGTGTSITQAAMRMLAQAGVLVGFCGGGGTPLLMANEVEWLTPQSEYRPTEYMQGWMKFWFDEQKRLYAAKQFQLSRIEYLRVHWKKSRDLAAEGFNSDDLQPELLSSELKIKKAKEVVKLMQNEAELTKQLYRYAANRTQYGKFIREREAIDKANIFLNHGNYLAYGLAATTLWVLGIPHGFAVMHGKTRRGALVFDVADLIKDALILPWAFICAKENSSEQEFRQQCLQAFIDHKALDYMFEQVKAMALNTDWESENSEENLL
ncbi:TPA: type I-F CRISPR-associated endonuclease Cas1 [Legionella pneumophila subsp. pneumophila]|uniref:CRISPR-associated endonuclease Cas1 n=2 Tax=Legionella pneumophila TaxID=446 RepID=Q5WSP1_LEGPL|nr:type I-F CRISPR-associated endonuclease Cas1f [Legionella pneumophila]AOW53344.1 subtype I-F CRISPR-associated endonuclease Cas1 [Legionella pneumophila subsp. pneumophila]AOW55759.1 subtype I-F CRISPR-associated endonuclease Cas1 [Legionella pneumophila subsp. pneumophila]AOW58678.1 subtype I-F CRISPR-associated endonuclease Cas1 [Legionella pneumophila subsp. pneumophila]AOW61136.1 subtype I-F CRISPR-associated endonuclease Cas1 [Legionella pneumophila subsp. pneumophila]AOW64142.1 subtyp